MTEPDNDSAALTILGINLQHRRLLRLRFPRGDGPEHVVLVANALDAVEGLSRDFVFTVELLSDSAIIDLDSVLGKMVTVELIKDDGTLRFFNGYVFEFSLVKTDGGSAYYSMVLRPWLAYLHLRSNSVAFHKLTVVELTDIVLGYYGKRDWTHRIGGANPAVTYICQHNESDHNLLHRYWEGAGWSYFYEHRADGHALRLSDDTRVSGAAIDLRVVCFAMSI
ncbi:MAG: type VI secretion system Vgr family protein [Telluria sp.]